MKDLEKCVYKKEVSHLLNYISVSRNINSKVEILKHMRESPMYQCYFCDGYNYNCESYETEKYIK